MAKLPTENFKFSIRDQFQDRYTNPKPTEADRIQFQAAKTEASQMPSTMRRLHFEFDRSLTGDQLAEALKQSLQENDIDPDNVLIRFFSKSRLQFAMSAGTDRDTLSRVGYNGSYDGEEDWMRGLGIRNNQDVTFAAPVGKRLTGGADAPKSHDYAYIIFDKRHLYKVGHNSNGFHAFLTTPSRACLGFVSDQGNIPLKTSAVFEQKRPTIDGPA